ncbi:RNA-binding protein [Acaryochloris sp. 'Moss Beach']|uniref:Jag family protein n=1 Tax=Acaryochloris TaxID=155977 RepID=UPI001BAFDF95|nr:MULTISPECIES: R3H domain-containing nucleic acid-binding protein [Acaryochloris]QUY42601.1 RNA-binding protein [Acaryochloris marina S15]UJB71683.1 RNA-binding protein [Acaryochloris sp. 'Moss Beach']
MSESNVQQGQEWLSHLLGHLGIETPVSSDKPDIAQTKFKDFGGFWLTIDDSGLSPEQVDLLIGHDGRMLDAIQYLINSTLNLGKDKEDRTAYTIEMADVRVKRYEELSQLAIQAAQSVRETEQEYVLPPINSAERRLVHTMLFDESDLETVSRGQEPDRRLVVMLATGESAEED